MAFNFLSHSPPTPPPAPRNSFQQMARMMDSLIMDPFMGSSPIGGTKGAINRANVTNHHKPVGPVRPRTLSNNVNNPTNRNRLDAEHGASNPNIAGEWNRQAKRDEDNWKASLRKRDPEIQPALPQIPRSRSAF